MLEGARTSSYAHERGRLFPGAERDGGVGGAARGVKCLHAHYAHHLAGGPDPIGLWVAERLAEGGPVHYERPAERLAAIDLGTNSIRLLVGRWADGTLTELARDMVIVRLGQDVDRTKRIAPDALARTVDVLKRYCRRARALGATRIRLSATSAVRDASNRADLDRAVTALDRRADGGAVGGGRGAHLVPGRDARPRRRPARLPTPRPRGWSWTSAAAAPRRSWARAPTRPSRPCSTNMGSVRLTERFVRSDPPSPEDLDAVARRDRPPPRAARAVGGRRRAPRR